LVSQCPAASHATLPAFPPVGKKSFEGSPVNEVRDSPHSIRENDSSGQQKVAAPFLGIIGGFSREKQRKRGRLGAGLFPLYTIRIWPISFSNAWQKTDKNIDDKKMGRDDEVRVEQKPSTHGFAQDINRQGRERYED
jgi:hypothetical protein